MEQQQLALANVNVLKVLLPKYYIDSTHAAAFFQMRSVAVPALEEYLAFKRFLRGVGVTFEVSGSTSVL